MNETDKNIEQIRLEELKAEGTEAPEECAENEAAVRYLAAQTGIGHYDNINLLVMATLLIFTAVLFLAVNSGDNTTADNLPLTAESFLSGEYTKSLSKRYREQLPIPEEMTLARGYVAMAYGFGNSLPDRRHSNSGSNVYVPDQQDPFEERDRDRDDISERTVTMTSVVTDENGETVTTEVEEAGDRSGGTTAVSRPTTTTTDPMTTTTTTSSTTTNNDPPFVTTTTTVMYTDPVTEPPTETTSEEPPTETQPPVTSDTETETSQQTELPESDG